MLSHYQTLRDQLTADVEATLGDGCRISYGRLTKPKAAIRYGIVFTNVDRSGKGRHVDESWLFRIMLVVPLPSGSEDAETVLFGLAGDLAMRLAPYSLDDVPDPSGKYAGVGAQRKVGKVQSTDLESMIEDSSTHVGVLIEFSCTTGVYQ